jgi:hypothetical protein
MKPNAGQAPFPRRIHRVKRSPERAVARLGRSAMARYFLNVTVIAVAAWLASPAAAQFGTIFGNEPPRPPEDLPRRRPPPPPEGPSRGPPAQPLPPGPPPSAIQSQPLPPPPGAGPPQQGSAPRSPAEQANRPGQPPLSGLPPGQRQPRGTPQPDAPPSDEVVVGPPAAKVTNPTAVFSGLDKITGRIINFDVSIGETVQFGALQVTPRACYTRPPTDTPNTDAFLEVDEITLQGEVRRVFTGWMFAASPGLHAVEHPIYDVWLVDCKGGTPPTVTAAQPDPPERPAQPERPRQQREQRPQRRPPPEPPPFIR